MVICVNRFFEFFLDTPFGHALSGVRVQKVQKVQKVQRGKVLRIDRPDGRRVLRFDGLSGRGLWYRPAGDEYKFSVTDSPFCVIWHDRHSVNWLAALASPFPATPDFPRKRGQNKTPRNTLLINGSTVSKGYSATVEVLHRTSKWGEVRRLACPLRRFPFAAPPNCGGGKGTGFIGEPRDPRIQ